MPDHTTPSNPPPADSDFSALIAAVCDGIATPEEQARLETILRDPEARRTFVAFTRLNADLRWRLRREHAEAFAAEKGLAARGDALAADPAHVVILPEAP